VQYGLEAAYYFRMLMAAINIHFAFPYLRILAHVFLPCVHNGTRIMESSIYVRYLCICKSDSWKIQLLTSSRYLWKLLKRSGSKRSERVIRLTISVTLVFIYVYTYAYTSS
jgi:hypothetical protein